MKLRELFGQDRPVFSCEVFPPKKSAPVDSIYQTLDGLKDIRLNAFTLSASPTGRAAPAT